MRDVWLSESTDFAPLIAPPENLPFSVRHLLSICSGRRAKNATVTHELRTPLNAIINYAEMLEEDLAKGEPSLARDAARIGGAGKGLLGLIENVLNYTMIETGDLKLMPVSTDVRAVFASVVEVATPLAKANSNALNAILSPDIDIEMVDERRLRECLSALLNNACRFTRNASVVISADRLQTPSGRWLEFVVDDRGCGISVEQQQNLFEPFSQADGALTRKHDGFGLGLAVTQRLARLMGGDLKLQSKAEPGARFVLTIACGVPDDQEAAARSIAR